MRKVIKPIKLLFDGFFTALIQGCSSVSLQSEELLESRLLGAKYLIIDSHESPNLAEDCLLAQPIERLLTRKLPLKSVTPAAEFDPQQSLQMSSKN